MSKVIGPPARTAGKIFPKRFLYSGTLFIRRSTSSRMSKLSPGKTKPAASTLSVGGMNACATSRCGWPERVKPSGNGKTNPRLLLNGSSLNEAKREFHINVGKKAELTIDGVRRWLRGPARPGPTIPLLSTPIAMDWVSPNAFVGE